MAILKLQLDEPVEVALKFAKGKFYESKFPGQDGQLMYSLTSGECVFLPESTDELFAGKGIGANEPIVLCLRKTRAGAKFLEVHKMSDAEEPAAPALDPRRYPDAAGAFESNLKAALAPSKLESQLAASITQQQQRKALASKLTPPVTAVTNTTEPPSINPIAIVPKPKAGSLMASALVAAIDACIIAQEYATSRGLAVTFAAEDLRAIAATLYIQHAKDPQYAQRAGGRQ